MPNDEKFMSEALRLARRGLGKTRPNPAVGCVLVKDDQIIGRGWHHRAGQPHAEIEALRSLKDPTMSRGTTAYVTLEPCSSQGRTPPCSKALAAAQVGRVVFGAIDPNPNHRGRALAELRRAKIPVTPGVLAEACAALNPEFHYFMSTGLPWVVAKCGMSLDGRLTRPMGEPRFITSSDARKDAMKLRTRVDAILVGAGTVRADNPALTVRGISGASQPWRLVWAPRTPLATAAKVLTDRWAKKTLILKQKTLRSAMMALGQRGITSVLVEGGGHTLGQLFHEGLACEVVFYVSPLLAGGAVPAIGGRGTSRLDAGWNLPAPKYTNIGGCLRISGRISIGDK